MCVCAVLEFVGRRNRNTDFSPKQEESVIKLELPHHKTSCPVGWLSPREPGQKRLGWATNLQGQAEREKGRGRVGDRGDWVISQVTPTEAL